MAGTGSVTSGGYNISDGTVDAWHATNNPTGSGYAGSTGDVFNVTGVTFDADMKPSGASLNTLTSLPRGFPATYFDGTKRDTPATAGAVKH
jgi:hypothetical protein